MEATVEKRADPIKAGVDLAKALAPAVAIVEEVVPRYAALYVFGSRACGEARPDSDVDLAVLADHRVPVKQLFDLHLRLAMALPWDVDLVDLQEASTILQFEVVSAGLLLAAPRPFDAAMFEVRVDREYQDLKARRREVEADIVKRGYVVHG